MRRVNFILPKYDWHVRVFMPVSSLNVTEIMAALNRVGISQTNLRNAYECIMKEEFDCGLTFSNPRERESVLVVGVASSVEEFYNTLQHEQTHLAMHVAEAYGIDVLSEEFAYLVGDIARMLFPTAEPFLCEQCRNKATNRFAQLR